MLTPNFATKPHQHVFIWADEVRGDDAGLGAFLELLASAWHRFQTTQLAFPIPRFKADSFACVRNATFPRAQVPSIDVN